VISVQGIASMTALKVDASATTQPISAASLPLPSGASTAAKQPALGTAGSASSDVITVQGVTSMTALKVDGSGVTQPVSGTVSAAQSGTWTVQPGNTANTTAWKVDGSAVTQPVSGTITANAGTGNFGTNVAQISGSTVSTAATGVQKVGVVGNAGATVDATVGAGTAPTNAVITGALFNSTNPAPTTGQSLALQTDQSGALRTFAGMPTATLSAWTSATSINATQTIFSNSGADAVLVQLVQTTTITVGAATFEVTFDGTNWVTIPANCVVDPTSTTYAAISLPYTLQASTNKPFLLISNGWQGLRVKLSTAITGSGSVTPNYALLGFSPVDVITAYQATAANLNCTASQGGTWTVQPGNTANTTAWKVDGSAVTQPVSAASLPLPSGASTAAKQPALGTAGSASADVISVQGIASMTALKVDGSGVTQPVSGTVTATANQSGTWTVQPGNTPNTSAWLTQSVTGTGGGWSVSSQTALTNTKTQVKSGAGNFGGYMFYNPNASVEYIQVWDVASGSITVGTTAPTYVIPIPATTGANVEFSVGIAHATAINIAATTTPTGSTAPGTALVGFVIYK
jgi:hypothetical protein